MSLDYLENKIHMNDILKSISAVLPTIATALGGPLAGIAVKAIAGTLGVPTDSSPESVTKLLGDLDPQKLQEFAIHEADVKLKMAELGYNSIKDIEEVNAKVVMAVNETMKVEATAEHWP